MCTNIRVWHISPIGQVQRPTALLSAEKPGSNNPPKINERVGSGRRRVQSCPMTARPQGEATDANQEATWSDWGQINAAAVAAEEQVLPPNSLPSSAVSDSAFPSDPTLSYVCAFVCTSGVVKGTASSGGARRRTVHAHRPGNAALPRLFLFTTSVSIYSGYTCSVNTHLFSKNRSPGLLFEGPGHLVLY